MAFTRNLIISVVFFCSTFTMYTDAVDLSPTLPKIKDPSSRNTSSSYTKKGSQIIIHDKNKFNENTSLKPDGADSTKIEPRINTTTNKPEEDRNLENDSNNPMTDTLTDSNANDDSKKGIIITVISILVITCILFILISFCLRKRYNYAQKIWSGLAIDTSKCICLKCEGGMPCESDIELGQGEDTDGEKEKLNDT